MGFTLNMHAVGAALAVGIVIDDAIVVLENIYRFIHEKRQKRFRIGGATKDIGLRCSRPPVADGGFHSGRVHVRNRRPLLGAFV